MRALSISWESQKTSSWSWNGKLNLRLSFVCLRWLFIFCHGINHHELHHHLETILYFLSNHRPSKSGFFCVSKVGFCFFLGLGECVVRTISELFFLTSSNPCWQTLHEGVYHKMWRLFCTVFVDGHVTSRSFAASKTFASIKSAVFNQ